MKTGEIKCSLLERAKSSKAPFVLVFFLFLFPVYSCVDESSTGLTRPFSFSPEKQRFISATKSVIESHLNNLGDSKLVKQDRVGLLGSEFFMHEVANQVNSYDFNYQTLPTNSWADQNTDLRLGLATEQNFDLNNLSSPVRNHIERFESRIDAIVSQYEGGLISEEEGLAQIKGECNREGNSAFVDPRLTEVERSATSESFLIMDELTVPITQYLESYSIAQGLDGRFFRKLLRAVARVVVAVVVTAVIIAVPVVAVVAAKAALTGVTLSAVKIGAAKGLGAIMKASVIKGKIGGISTYSPIMTGMYAGLKNAEKNWDKSWQGASEFVFGYKIKI